MEKKKQPNHFFRYSTIGFELAVPIIGGYYLGKYLDDYFQYESIFKALMSLGGVGLGLYLALRDLLKSS